MGRCYKPIIIVSFLLSIFIISAQGQNYRDQKKLIRLKPNNLLVFGQILEASGETISGGATVTLFDPPGAKMVETIPVDDLGEYLFILEKGKTYGLIVEKEGCFPFYSQFVVPTDEEEEWEWPIQLPDQLQNRYELKYPPMATGPSNPETLDSLVTFLSQFSNIQVWIPELSDSIFPLRTSRIKSKFIDAGIESFRIHVGPTPGSADQFVILEFINDNTGVSIEGDPTDEDISEYDSPDDPLPPGKWTLQFLASRRELQSSDLKGIKEFRMFEGKDGYYRYTYGVYDSKEKAQAGQSYLRSKGFSQSMVKKIEDLQKL